MVLAALLALLFPAVAGAHAFLVRTTPRVGERLGTSPPDLALQFSEPFVPGSGELVLRRADGPPVPLGPAEQNGTLLLARLPPLEDGVYRVSWRVLADDGHASAGEFAFGVGRGGRLEAAPVGPGAVSWPEATAEALLLLGLALAAGGLASEALVWRPLARRCGVAVPPAAVGPAVALALLGAGVQLALLATSGVGSAPPPGAVGDAPGSLLSSRPWLLSAWALGLAGYALWLLRLPRLRAWALLPLGGAAAAVALRGHGGTSPAWWAAPANFVHLVLAALWVGALVHLVQVLWRLRGADEGPVLAAAARRYAGLAVVLVPALLGAGVATALAELSAPAELVETTYGRVLLVKLLVVAGALALALVARRRALPPPTRLPSLRRLASAEAGALVVAVLVTAVLANTAPPRTVAAEADLLGPAPLPGPVVRLAGLAGNLAVHLAAAEGELQVRVLTPGGEPDRVARLQLSGRGPDGAGVDLFPRSCGAGCSAMAYAWPAGTTQLLASVVDDDGIVQTLEFAVPWPPAPEEPELVDRVARAMRAQPRIILTENVSSGPGATAPPNTFPISGAQFMAQEAYAAGGASDVRPLPSGPGERVVALFVPGSDLWYRLEIGPDDRLRRETVVSPGHLIERTFAYEGAP